MRSFLRHIVSKQLFFSKLFKKNYLLYYYLRMDCKYVLLKFKFKLLGETGEDCLFKVGGAPMAYSYCIVIMVYPLITWPGRLGWCDGGRESASLEGARVCQAVAMRVQFSERLPPVERVVSNGVFRMTVFG